MRVALIGCVKSKRATATAAGNLYISPLFVGLRSYAIANADSWFVLSAKHGLLSPETVVEPYERTLNTMSQADRRVWAEKVQGQLATAVPAGATVIMLAGARYRSALVDSLRSRGLTVLAPFAGLPLGKQLQRLKQLRELGYRER
jgi:hypothetical protein